MTDLNENEHQWALDTALALRERRLNDVDVERVADEIYSFATGLESEFTRRLCDAMFSLMQYAHISGTPPEKAQWLLDAKRELIELQFLLERYPTITTRIAQADIQDEYRFAKYRIEILYGENAAAMIPDAHPYTLQWIQDHVDLQTLHQ